MSPRVKPHRRKRDAQMLDRFAPVLRVGKDESEVQVRVGMRRQQPRRLAQVDDRLFLPLGGQRCRYRHAGFRFS